MILELIVSIDPSLLLSLVSHPWVWPGVLGRRPGRGDSPALTGREMAHSVITATTVDMSLRRREAWDDPAPGPKAWVGGRAEGDLITHLIVTNAFQT
jgi:hypothetical protein